jgi:predicted GH43/DUF377 family glycosyl hydrolase
MIRLMVVYTSLRCFTRFSRSFKETRLPYPLFKPDLKYELAGYVNNVVFPTGTALLMVDYLL